MSFLKLMQGWWNRHWGPQWDIFYCPSRRCQVEILRHQRNQLILEAKPMVKYFTLVDLFCGVKSYHGFGFRPPGNLTRRSRVRKHPGSWNKSWFNLHDSINSKKYLHNYLHCTSITVENNIEQGRSAFTSTLSRSESPYIYLVLKQQTTNRSIHGV